MNLQGFIEDLKGADTLQVDGLFVVSFCVFDTEEHDCFLWVSLDNNVFVKFHKENNQNLEMSMDGFYLYDDFGIKFAVVPFKLSSGFD